MKSVRVPRRHCSVQYFESKQFLELSGPPVTRAIRSVYRALSFGAEHTRSYVGATFSSSQVVEAAKPHAVGRPERIIVLAAPVIYWGKTNIPRLLHSNSRVDSRRSTLDLAAFLNELSTHRGSSLVLCFVPEVLALRASELMGCVPTRGCVALAMLPIPIVERHHQQSSTGEALLRSIRTLAFDLESQSYIYGGPVSQIGYELLRQLSQTWPYGRARVLARASSSWIHQAPLPDVLQERVPEHIRADYFHHLEECREESIEEIVAAANAATTEAEKGRLAALVLHLALRSRSIEGQKALMRRILDLHGNDVPGSRNEKQAWNIDASSLVEIAFGKIPPGYATVGENAPVDCAHHPRHKIFVDSFQISILPIQKLHFAMYLKAVEQEIFVHSDTPENCPAQYVSWYDAVDFCAWLQAKWRADGSIGATDVVRLPTELEWERASRGDDGRCYPWGNSPPTPRNCNSLGAGYVGVTPVGAFSPEGDSPFGVADMCGNVYEWTSSLWGESAAFPDFRYPYVANDGREDLKADSATRRVIRGGAYFFRDDCVTTFTRNGKLPTARERGGGFRIVLITGL